MTSTGTRSVPRFIAVTSMVTVVLCLVAAAFSWRRGLLHCAVPLLAAVSTGLLPLHFTTWGARHKRGLAASAIVVGVCIVAAVAVL
jgi:hypothetical protein